MAKGNGLAGYGEMLSLAIVKQFVCESIYIRRRDPAAREKLLAAGWEEVLEDAAGWVFRHGIVAEESALQSVRIN
jgi:hypothetical protein